MINGHYSDLKGKRALITGGLGNLGRALCVEFAEQGLDLIILDKSPRVDDFLEKLRAKSVTVDYFQVDFVNQENRSKVIEKMKNEYKCIDILVNNAAYVGATDVPGWAVQFKDQSIQTWNDAIEVNLTTPFHLIQGLQGLISSSQEPAILNIGSIYGSYGPDWDLYAGTSMGNPAAYSASKGGLIQLTRWLATTLGPTIRVNCLSPGGIFRDQDNSFIEKYKSRTPLGRMAVENEIVATALFLVSNSSAYITGQNIQVDGGWGVW